MYVFTTGTLKPAHVFTHSSHILVGHFQIKSPMNFILYEKATEMLR